MYHGGDILAPAGAAEVAAAARREGVAVMGVGISTKFVDRVVMDGVMQNEIRVGAGSRGLTVLGVPMVAVLI